MFLRQSTFPAVALLLVSTYAGSAAPVTIDAADSGHYDSAGAHTVMNPNYLTGVFLGTERRGFFIFDLSGVSGTIESATLRLFNPFVSQFQPGYSSPDPTETLNIYDVHTSVEDISLGMAGVAGFQDLGSGALFGTRIMSAADNGTVVEIELNSAALAGIEAASGRLVLGAALGSIGSGDQFVFGHSMAAFVDNRTRELVLDVAQAEVPEPSTFLIMGLGGVLLLVGRRR